MESAKGNITMTLQEQKGLNDDTVRNLNEPYEPGFTDSFFSLKSEK